MNRVYIKTYGCQMNERDSEAVASILSERGYAIVNDEASANIVLLNTCSVRELAEQKAIGKAGHLLRRKKKDRSFLVGILGCMAQNRGRDLLDQLPDLDLVVGTQKFHRTPDYLDTLRQNPLQQPPPIVQIEEESGSENTIRDHLGDRAEISSFVSIMQGCNMRCSFCIVPKTRGAERSRPMEDIVEEVEDLVSRGTREVTLLGQIVNQYGRYEFPVIKGQSPFVQLLEKINEIKGLERIRFTSPHPRGFRRDLIEAYRDLPKLCEYVHLPLQSGSDEVLRRMKRPYTVAKFEALVHDLRSMVSEIAFSTDVIVGFPGETEEDFEKTRSVFERIGFDMAFIFKYSPRPGTVAALEPDSISEETKNQRNQVLLSILHQSSLARNLSRVGKIEEVLLEGEAKRGEAMFVGRTRTHRKVVVAANPRLIGQIVPVEITEATVSTLLGKLVLQGVPQQDELAPIAL
ncbi:MAG: tRNA (N6-isopentenyl adenosine(37)-C2)-methylthiotransferase MiaB [Puniceicoccaceae bacterium]